MSIARQDLEATHVGNYALFGGGDASYYGTGVSNMSPTVDAYDTSLTRTTPTELSVARIRYAATHVGDYALFGGGHDNDETSVVDAYNTSLTRTTPTVLHKRVEYLAATHVGDYALFGGGTGSDENDGATVSAYVVL